MGFRRGVNGTQSASLNWRRGLFQVGALVGCMDYGLGDLPDGGGHLGSTRASAKVWLRRHDRRNRAEIAVVAGRAVEKSATSYVLRPER
jgi:hypothetical protein